MLPIDPEYFGDSEHLEVQARVNEAWPTLGGNSLLNNAGRFVGLDDPGQFGLAATIDLIHRFSVVGVFFKDDRVHPGVEQELAAHDIRLSTYDVFRSGAGTPATVAGLISTRPIPTDWQWVRIYRDSPARDVGDFQQLANDCGVAPPPGYVLRGALYGTDCFLLRDAAGDAVATAGVVDRHPPNGPRANEASSGLVATRPDQRKLGFGQLVYAKALSALFRRRPKAIAYTAVKLDNIASRKMCEGVGLQVAPGEKISIAISNRTYPGEGSFTR